MTTTLPVTNLSPSIHYTKEEGVLAYRKKNGTHFTITLKNKGSWNPLKGNQLQINDQTGTTYKIKQLYLQHPTNPGLVVRTKQHQFKAYSDASSNSQAYSLPLLKMNNPHIEICELSARASDSEPCFRFAHAATIYDGETNTGIISFNDESFEVDSLYNFITPQFSKKTRFLAGVSMTFHFPTYTVPTRPVDVLKVFQLPLTTYSEENKQEIVDHSIVPDSEAKSLLNEEKRELPKAKCVLEIDRKSNEVTTFFLNEATIFIGRADGSILYKELNKLNLNTFEKLIKNKKIDFKIKSETTQSDLLIYEINSSEICFNKESGEVVDQKTNKDLFDQLLKLSNEEIVSKIQLHTTGITSILFDNEFLFSVDEEGTLIKSALNSGQTFTPVAKWLLGSIERSGKSSGFLCKPSAFSQKRIFHLQNQGGSISVLEKETDFIIAVSELK